MSFIKSAAMFSLGGLTYGIIEIVWRGQTHISMFVAGGLCFWGIWQTAKHLSELGLIILAAISALEITAVEFSVGILVNIILKLNVWDYSGMPFSLMGQVCLPFGVLWFLLSIPALYLSAALDRLMFGSRPFHISILPHHARKKQPV